MTSHHADRYPNRTGTGAGTRYLHVASEARERFAIDAELFGLRGRILFGDLGSAHRLAARMNEVREADRYPELAVPGSELFAAALLHELMHAVIETVGQTTPRGVLAPSLERIGVALGGDALANTLHAFAERFPAPSVASGEESADAYLKASSGDTPNTEVVLEEALLVWLANANPALERMQELFDDGPLRRASAYDRALRVMESGLREHGPRTEGGMTLIDVLWAPQRRSPTSLEGQLAVVEALWAPLLGERYAGLLARLLRSVDALREERLRGPAGPGPAVVLDAAALAGAGEVEAFSPDSDWMPRVVLVAKSTYVWLAQLERRFGREVRRLDQIPDEALDELAGFGFNALWLIGLWERSQASRRIKQRRGQGDALASAYALYDYVVAGDLGGEAALRDLAARAARRGLRLAGDMVPNHVGIDGRWVAEHPDWFVQLDHPPYPGYRFDGPDLSDSPAMAVMLEDHYWNDSDAAVVFKRVDRDSGRARYLYHGNDGTTMPWNDTAQLDYLNPEVREAVIQTILHVARTVPIIRFDAAMTLAKRHIQRLWYPAPGHGGAIPSRSAYGGMSAEEFERRMPVEFWREVVDRVAREAPGTLLLAEAFWMMEGYFVRTLGMHRVYNSAFMNMLKREENGDYRRLMKNVLSFDPRILGRFVNFMNNPDEETAIAQFGDGDKYFGVAVMMATLPGLPMFGHGQVEGLREKYGMEYRAPALDESPVAGMVERHRRQIAPLLHRRAQFASAESFRLYDAWAGDGTVDEAVFAYSNRATGAASLVLYNNRYQRTTVTVYRSAPFAEPWNGGAERDEALHQALGVAAGRDRFVVLRERLSGLDSLRRADDIVQRGLTFELDGFQAMAFTEIVEVVDVDGSYAGLHDMLAGRGVADLEEARLDWWWRVSRERFLVLLEAARQQRPRQKVTARDGADARARGRESPGQESADRDQPRGDAVARAAQAFVAALGERGVTVTLASDATPAAGAHDAEPAPAAAPERAAEDEAPAAGVPDESSRQGTADASASDEPVAAALRDALVGGAAGPATVHDAALAALTRAGVSAVEAAAWGTAALLRATLVIDTLRDGPTVYREARLQGALEEALRERDVDDPWAAARLPVLLAELTAVNRPISAATLLAAIAASPSARSWLGVHDHQGVRWFRQERFRLLQGAVLGLAAARGAADAELVALRRGLTDAERASGYRFERLVEPTSAPGAAETATAPTAGEGPAAADDDVDEN